MPGGKESLLVFLRIEGRGGRGPLPERRKEKGGEMLTTSKKKGKREDSRGKRGKEEAPFTKGEVKFRKKEGWRIHLCAGEKKRRKDCFCTRRFNPPEREERRRNMGPERALFLGL